MSALPKYSSLPKFKQMVRPTNKDLNTHVKQMTRLTVVIDTPSFLHNYNVSSKHFSHRVLQNLISDSNEKTSIINSYDLLALKCKQKVNGNQ